jgi:hypothetical protein
MKASLSEHSLEFTCIHRTRAQHGDGPAPVTRHPSPVTRHDRIDRIDPASPSLILKEQAAPESRFAIGWANIWTRTSVRRPGVTAFWPIAGLEIDPCLRARRA